MIRQLWRALLITVNRVAILSSTRVAILKKVAIFPRVAILKNSKVAEGSNPNDEQGSNLDSPSQSSNSDDDEDESTCSPSNLGPAIQAIEGDSEIFIRLPIPQREIPSTIINRSSVEFLRIATPGIDRIATLLTVIRRALHNCRIKLTVQSQPC